MKEKINNILPYIITLCLGVLTILFFWQIPYIARFDGYAMLGMWDTGAWGIVLSFFQTWSLLEVAGLIIVSVTGILQEYNIVKVKNKSKFTFRDINFISLCSVTGLSIFVFIWTAVFGGISGLGFGLGSVLLMLVNIACMLLIIFKYKPDMMKVKKEKEPEVEVIEESLEDTTEGE